MQSVIQGVGSYLPKKVLLNNDLKKYVDTSDEWIRKRTGIEQRHIAADGELTSDLAVKAAQKALKASGINAQEIDLIIVATCTPDYTFPSTATHVQKKLGITTGVAFDIHAACSGFIFALSQADNMLRLGQARCALIIGAETMSRILDWKDRTTCVLFGDGAGALILKAQEQADSGVIATKIKSNGFYYDKLRTDGGPSATGTTGTIAMDGKEVFKFASLSMSNIVSELLEENNIKKSQIDWLIPHQANKRIMDMVGHSLGIPSQKVICSLAGHGNTSAATIPLALDYGVLQGKIKKGDLLALTAMGAGFTWAGALLNW